jgi:hypothetical protein
VEELPHDGNSPEMRHIRLQLHGSVGLKVLFHAVRRCEEISDLTVSVWASGVYALKHLYGEAFGKMYPPEA